MYTVADYGRMVACTVRMDAYARALERAVKPGSVVVDIGAGTGIFSLLAARAGARRVHAIEPNAAVLLLPEVAAENGLADRITVHNKSSFDVDLDERADVLVADLRGSFPIGGAQLATLRDAKARLLKPDGVMLPLRDRLLVAGVEAAQASARFPRALEGFSERGFSSNALGSSMANTVWTDNLDLRANDLMTTAETWATLEYGTSEGSLEGEVVLRAMRRGKVRALGLWFEATVAEGIVFANPPGAALVYARYYLPLLAPIDLAEDDTIHVVLRTDERGERWAWDTRVVTAVGATKARLRQASFFGMPASKEALLRSSSSHVPTIGAKGARIQRILDLMDGGRSVDDIVDTIVKAGRASLPRAVVLEEVRAAVERYGA